MRFLPFIMIVMMSLACGRLDEQQPDDPQDRIRLARADELESGLVHPHSYLVAFKEAQPSSRNLFAHKMRLSQMLGNAGTVRSHAFFQRLNISKPGLSFVDMSLDAHPFVQDNLPADNVVQLTEVKFADEEEAQRLLQEWDAEGMIAFAEPNFQQGLKGEVEDAVVENFTNLRLPWLDQLNFVEAIQRMGTIGAKAAPVVAVMDSGVDVEHPYLRDAIYKNELGQNKLCRDDLYGCNTTNAEKENLGNGDVFPPGTSGFGQSCSGSVDECSHGTHVAGLVAARGSQTYSGLCPYCQILVVKVTSLDKTGAYKIKDSSILAGLSYVSGFLDGGKPLVRVINASFGKFERSRSVELFIEALRDRGRGTLMVAAAGNEDSMKREYPAAFDSVLSVSNVISDTAAPKKSRSSSFGVWVDIAAPGDGDCVGGDRATGILSTVPGGSHGCLTGSSMASPIVAGIAGLVVAAEPDISAVDLERRLLNASVAANLYAPGVNDAYRPKAKGAPRPIPLLGNGVVNALFALDPSLHQAEDLKIDEGGLVRSGCGVLGGSSTFGTVLLFLPLIFVLRKRARR